ncbi:MAG: hypothetical protein QM781_04845 [Chitinophagaceae bacterium]
MDFFSKRFEEWKGQWADPSKMELSDYISFNLHPEDFLIFSSLLFPELIEVDGCVFFKTHYNPDSYSRWKKALYEDRSAIEKMINHVHVYDLFDHRSGNVSESVFDEVGKLLQTSWSCYFRFKYPEWQIAVEYSNSDQDYGPTLYVYRK